jgi:hypothetical protein
MVIVSADNSHRSRVHEPFHTAGGCPWPLTRDLQRVVIQQEFERFLRNQSTANGQLMSREQVHSPRRSKLVPRHRKNLNGCDRDVEAFAAIRIRCGWWARMRQQS